LLNDQPRTQYLKIGGHFLCLTKWVSRGMLVPDLTEVRVAKGVSVSVLRCRAGAAERSRGGLASRPETDASVTGAC
jgi:hypothetical protein